jgi:hypothetical protein
MAGFTADSFAPASSMANSDVLRMFVYKTPDTKANCVASGYFNDAVVMGLKAQDIVWCFGVTGGTEVFFMVSIDAISAAGVVTTLSSSLTLA